MQIDPMLIAFSRHPPGGHTSDLKEKAKRPSLVEICTRVLLSQHFFNAGKNQIFIEGLYL